MHSAILETATLRWDQEEDCRRTAQWLALCPGFTEAVVTLEGDLGAGKTTFTRHLLRSLGVEGRIKSPTYAVVEPYEWQADGRLMHAYHFDFYRFRDPGEWEEAGFRDVFAACGLKLCEWPEKAMGCLPTPDLAVRIAWSGADADAPPEQRQVELRAYTYRAADWLRGHETTQQPASGRPA